MFFIYFQPILGHIVYNVPAGYDVLAARIRALRSKDQVRQNVGGVRRGNEAKRNDLAVAEAEPPTGGVPSVAVTLKQPCYVQVFCFIQSISFFIRKVLFNTRGLPWLK
jgi:hypothetical protein